MFILYCVLLSLFKVVFGPDLLLLVELRPHLIYNFFPAINYNLPLLFDWLADQHVIVELVVVVVVKSHDSPAEGVPRVGRLSLGRLRLVPFIWHHNRLLEEVRCFYTAVNVHLAEGLDLIDAALLFVHVALSHQVRVPLALLGSVAELLAAETPLVPKNSHAVLFAEVFM
jgi:hypothetical protein